MSKVRDVFAWRVANWVLRTFASREYQERLTETFRRGLTKPSPYREGTDHDR